MIYECDKCEYALPAGVKVCPRCGEQFEDAVPDDAETPTVASLPAEEDRPFLQEAAYSFDADGVGEPRFDDACFERLMDALHAAADDLTWCASCHTVSRFGEWTASSDRCPRCRCPAPGRMLWSDLRLINPALPANPAVGQVLQAAAYG